LTKIVNALTVKMEVGAPMASMYLLGNPDHYTSHRFVPFYWKNYNKLYPSRVVDDYIFRPNKYSAFCLYDWVRLSRRQKRKVCKKENGGCEGPIESTSGEDSDSMNSVCNEDTEMSDVASDSDINSGENEKPETNTEGYLFLKAHPLHHTHEVICVKDNDKIVPNFIGGSLPRMIEGKSDYYHLTMLTIFKPWRDSNDLKSPSESWDFSFGDYNFDARKLEVMKFFKVRYECLDARDDYNALMRQNDQQSGNNLPFSEHEKGEIDSENHYDTIIDESMYAADDDSRMTDPGQTGSRRKEDRSAIKIVLHEVGWMERSGGSV
ncbi:hypothetical protein GALMADRAFT_45270, partial [Galerina marginata CBS 339.88]